jgi:exoribonuclease R
MNDFIRRGIEDIRAEMSIDVDFGSEVEAAAESAANQPRLPELDRTDIVGVDRGYRVHYAIADLAAFVTPGDAVDLAAHRRGETLYGADSKVPLHPKSISEGAGSLLPDQVRPALLWSIDLDLSGEPTSARVERALVRSRAKMNYAGAQADIEAGGSSETLRLLRVVGQLRETKERERGGVSLPLPDQEILIEGDEVALAYRSPLPVEGWNAQISLLTGLSAATLMLAAKVGLLRTLPKPAEQDVARLRRTAQALGISWPTAQGYAEFVRGLDSGEPDEAAMITSCTRLLRGSGYVGFSGELPSETLHSAVAAPYAHVTAPLRRLIDRYTGEICLAICANQPVPEWVLSRLGELPETMRESGRRANRYERAVVDLVEAGLLQHRVGEKFPAVVVSVDERDQHRGVVMIQSPAIESVVTSTSKLGLGDEVTVRLSQVDLPKRKVSFVIDREAK